MSRRGARFRFHLATLLACVPVAAFFLWLNVREYRLGDGLLFGCGWPWPYWICSGVPQCHVASLCFDGYVAFVALLVWGRWWEARAGRQAAKKAD